MRVVHWSWARWFQPPWDQDAVGTLAKVALATLGAVGILATALQGHSLHQGLVCSRQWATLGAGKDTVLTLTLPLSQIPAPAALSSSTKLQPLSWGPIPP